jgi:hypothetical protein
MEFCTAPPPDLSCRESVEEMNSGEVIILNKQVRAPQSNDLLYVEEILCTEC